MSLLFSLQVYRLIARYSSILDGRMAFETVKGSTITCAFGTKAQIEEWTPMSLPQLPDIEKIVADMESNKFGINKKFFSIRKSPA